MLYKKYEYRIVRDMVDTSDFRIERPAAAFDLFKEFAGGSTQESLFVMAVDGRNNLIGVQELYRGTATGTSIRIGEIMSSVLLAQGVGMVLVHNHPSGDPESSEEDLRLTIDVVKACRLLDIEMLDHLIIGRDKFESIRSKKPYMWEVSE